MKWWFVRTIDSQWIVLFICKQSARTVPFVYTILIAMVLLIRHGSLLFHCNNAVHWLYTPSPALLSIDIIINIIVANIVHASCFEHANKSATSHNNLSNNEIIYLKCNWALWCSRTYETRYRTSIKSNVYRAHAHTHRERRISQPANAFYVTAAAVAIVNYPLVSTLEFHPLKLPW